MDDLTIIPSHETDYVELSRTKSGKLFKKHILTRGELIHPKTGTSVKIDDDFIATLDKNFRDRVCDIVQIPLAGKNNEHVENPDANLGEVVDLSYDKEAGKLYAHMDFRKSTEDVGKTILGVSAMLSQNYTDTRTGQQVGPTLLHTCATNRPYIVDLDDYEEIVAASADGSSEAVVLTPPAAAPAETESVTTPKEDEIMDLDTMLTELNTEHGIDVRALQTRVGELEAAQDKIAASAAQLADAGLLKLTNGEEVSVDDIVTAVGQVADANVSLSSRMEALEADKTNAEIEALVSQGFIKPADKEAMLELKLSNEELFLKLLPENPVIQLSSPERGAEPNDPGGHEIDIDAEVDRYTRIASGASA